jgi:hypothetical protein
LAHETQQFKRAFEDVEQAEQPRPYRPEANQYPSIVVHASKGKKLVNSADEHLSLGDGWQFPGHEPPAEKKAASAVVAELPQEVDELIQDHGDRLTQLEAMVADLISQKSGKKNKPADQS